MRPGLRLSAWPAPSQNPGKWCAAHVQIAWQIYRHQQKIKVSCSLSRRPGRCVRRCLDAPLRGHLRSLDGHCVPLMWARGAGLGRRPDWGGSPRMPPGRGPCAGPTNIIQVIHLTDSVPVLSPQHLLSTCCVCPGAQQ